MTANWIHRIQDKHGNTWRHTFGVFYVQEDTDGMYATIKAWWHIEDWEPADDQG